jgi:hypothetical protein
MGMDGAPAKANGGKARAQKIKGSGVSPAGQRQLANGLVSHQSRERVASRARLFIPNVRRPISSLSNGELNLKTKHKMKALPCPPSAR